ncbi:hypothetical protein [Neobacillus soli]|nr:hypothetical protein [Neobacillus soli]
MEKLARLPDLCWEGITLKHVLHKKIVIPYLLFVFTALVFELFLTVLFIISSFLFYLYSFSSSFGFYVSGAILILLLMMTVSILIATIRKYKTGAFIEGD